MAKENTSQEVRSKNINEARKHSIEKINETDLTSKKYEKVCKNIDYFEHCFRGY